LRLLRLTLNVLLSFAQFEREVTSERIRDKIAASKRKGLWVGGIVPLGYATKDRKIVVVEQEAERVRTIFQRYLQLGSLNRLMADLRERGIDALIHGCIPHNDVVPYDVPDSWRFELVPPAVAPEARRT